MSEPGSPGLRSRRRAAARHATIPFLRVQAQNDDATTPSRALDAELTKAGKPHWLLIFPPFG